VDRSNLRVIVGGAGPEASGAGRRKNLVRAYVTDTRLMGVLVLYMQWKTPVENYILTEKNETLHQFFYIETTEAGIESYRSLTFDDEEMLEDMEQIMLGGLGGMRVPLTENEALYLLNMYADLNKRYGNPLPDNTEEYAFVLNGKPTLTEAEEDRLFKMTCGGVETVNQLVNYFLMRYFACDFDPIDRLSTTEIPKDLVKNNGSAVLCLNTIEKIEEDGQGSYLCESVLEDDRGYRIVVSELVIEGMKVSSMSIISEFSISSPEAAMKLSRPEFVTVFDLDGDVDATTIYLDLKYRGSLQNETQGGKLYVKFAADNSHVNSRVYRLNDDVEEILYITSEGQLIIGAYSLSRIQKTELKIYRTRLGKFLTEIGKFEFKEPILYDYTLGEGGDFLSYIKEIMNYEDD
jgi:hypothetical protein